MAKIKIDNGLYELIPDPDNHFLAKSQLVASKKMKVYQTDTGGYYIIKTVDAKKNVRKLYYPLSYGLGTTTYYDNIVISHEKVIFKENGEVKIIHTDNAIPSLTKEIEYRKEGSVYQRKALLQTENGQKAYHLEEDGNIYDEKGNNILKSLSNGFEKQSYIDALTARSKFRCSIKRNEEAKKQETKGTLK